VSHAHGQSDDECATQQDLKGRKAANSGGGQRGIHGHDCSELWLSNQTNGQQMRLQIENLGFYTAQSFVALQCRA
jgi:hypothetical protein